MPTTKVTRRFRSRLRCEVLILCSLIWLLAVATVFTVGFLVLLVHELVGVVACLFRALSARSAACLLTPGEPL